MRRPKAEGIEIYEVFTTIIAMLADTAYIFAIRADCPGGLLDKLIDLFKPFSEIFSNPNNFHQLV
jgi:hypothetical protein